MNTRQGYTPFFSPPRGPPLGSGLTVSQLPQLGPRGHQVALWQVPYMMGAQQPG